MLPHCTNPTICTILNAVVGNVLNPIMLLLAAASAVVFAWGIVEYLYQLSKGHDTNEGKDHMLWGVIGLFIVFGAYSIITIIANTMGALLR